MQKITLTTISLMIMTIGIKANILSNIFENVTVDGYLRLGYEVHNVKDENTFKDDAMGGKLNIQTAPLYGVSIGASFYTSNSMGSADNAGLVPFRGEVAHSYSILGEAYVEAIMGNTMLKIGRQEIDTPFAQIDDIGMVPNTFEAYILENKDIPDTTLFLGQIQKMAGVDAQVVDSFTPLNKDNNMQALGLSYDGIDNLTLSAWYYRLKNAPLDSIAYLEANYEGRFQSIDYALGLQYAKQTYVEEADTSIYGLSTNITHTDTDITLGIAYNKIDGNAASSGFGGGPFYSNSEYLVIDNVGKNGSQLWFGLAYDASKLGVSALTLSLSQAILTTQMHTTSKETDLVLNYALSKQSEFHIIYSDIKGGNVSEDQAKHLRFFANYHF